MYSPQVLDHFEHPRNAGALDAADGEVRVENPACGDVLQLMVKIANGRIEAIRFLAKGCVASMACGSAITELATGKTIAEARTLSRDGVLRAVGGLPPASIHASHLAVDALQSLLDQVGQKA